MATNATIRNVPSSGMKPKKKNAFDAQVFLDSVGASRKVQEFGKKQVIFYQGDAADSVVYVQRGSVKFTVVNEIGKEAVVAIFGSEDFFGEGSMAGQTIRMATATAIVPTTLLVIGKDEMTRVLHAEHELSDRFITYMLARNIRVEADLVLAQYLHKQLSRHGKSKQNANVSRCGQISICVLFKMLSCGGGMASQPASFDRRRTTWQSQEQQDTRISFLQRRR